MDNQKEKQRDRRIDRLAERWTDIQKEGQINRRIDIQTVRHL